MPADTDPGVTIGLREIYDTVVRTHEAVQSYAPRLDAVEKVADEAKQTADNAERRSLSNSRHISIMWKAFAFLIGGSALDIIGNYISKHMH